MPMKYHLMAFLAVLFVLASCGRKDIAGDIAFLNIESAINSRQFCDIDPDTLFEVVGLTAIQTSDTAFVVGPSIFGYKDGVIYCSDRYEHIWAIRESDGAILAHHNKIGNGPGEYLSLGNAVLDSERDMILVSDIKKNKILAYTLDGKFLPGHSKDSLGGVAVLPDGNMAGITQLDFSPSSNIVSARDSWYDIYDKDWNMLREGSVMKNKKKSRMIPYCFPRTSPDGTCYFLPFRNDTLYRVTTDADVPVAVFHTGRYATSDESYANIPKNDSPSIFSIQNFVIGKYAFCSFRLSNGGDVYEQVWDLSTSELVSNRYSKDSRSFFDINVSGKPVQFDWWHTVNGEIFCLLGYSEAVRFFHDMKEDDNPVILHLRYTGPELQPSGNPDGPLSGE